MADEIKFSDEELKELSELQQSYQEKQAILGQLAVQKILIEQQVEAIDTRQAEVESEYSDVQQTERDLVQKLNEKYGPGQLDPESGVFTPIPQEEAPSEESPQIEKIQSFIIPPKMGINYKPGIWHFPLISTEDTNFLVIDRKGKGENLIIHKFEKEKIILNY